MAHEPSPHLTSSYSKVYNLEWPESNNYQIHVERSVAEWIREQGGSRETAEGVIEFGTGQVNESGLYSEVERNETTVTDVGKETGVWTEQDIEEIQQKMRG